MTEPKPVPAESRPTELDKWIENNLPRFCQTAGGISTPKDGLPTMMAPLTYVNVKALLEAYAASSAGLPVGESRETEIKEKS